MLAAGSGESGTTVALLAVLGDRALVVNAGDSRVYRLDGGGAEVLSHDHSLVQSLVDHGHIGPGDVPGHLSLLLIPSAAEILEFSPVASYARCMHAIMKFALDAAADTPGHHHGSAAVRSAPMQPLTGPPLVRMTKTGGTASLRGA